MPGSEANSEHNSTAPASEGPLLGPTLIEAPEGPSSQPVSPTSAPAPEGLDKYQVYEDYLDALASSKDQFYLEDDTLVHQLVELGGRSSEVIGRQEFKAQREAAEQAKRETMQNAQRTLASAQKDLSAFPFLRHLAAR